MFAGFHPLLTDWTMTYLLLEDSMTDLTPLKQVTSKESFIQLLASREVGKLTSKTSYIYLTRILTFA